MSRDHERLEEEIAGAQRLARPASLATEYLMQALEGLHDAGDPAVLFAHWRRHLPADPAAEQQTMIAAARRTRIKAARTAVLLAALAAEAYVNEFLNAHVEADDFKVIQRMRTEDKYFVGTRLVYGERMFFRDREGAKELHELLELRNRLVHAKPVFGVTGVHGDATVDFEALFGLPKVAEYIVAVAGYADSMIRRAYDFDEFDTASLAIWRGREVVRGYASRQADLPAWDAPAERPLFRQAGDRVMATPHLPDHPDASWTRLREARIARDRGESSAE